MDISLIMFKADGTRREFPVVKERTVVGRQNTCDLRIPLSAVSREHCEITRVDDTVKIRDLGSSNGTYHNNLRIQEVTLAPGDELVVGPVVFTVVIDGVPENIEPVRTILHSQESGSVDVPVEASNELEPLEALPAAELDDVDGLDDLDALPELGEDVPADADALDLIPEDDDLPMLGEEPTELAPAAPADDLPMLGEDIPDSNDELSQLAALAGDEPAVAEAMPVDDDPFAELEALAGDEPAAHAPEVDLDDPIAALEAMADMDGQDSDELPMLAPDDEDR